MTDIERLLRGAYTDRAAHAPAVADLAGSTRSRVARQRRRRAQIGGAVVAATATMVAGAQLLARGDRPARPAGPGVPVASPSSAPRGASLVPDGYQGRFRVSATVLESPEHGPQLCHLVLDSYPPQCSGPDIVGWSWEGLEHESERGTTWGGATVVGTWDGSRFTVTEAPQPPAGTGSGLPPSPDLTPPCPEPAGGWRPSDPDRATQDAFDAATQWAHARPDFAGLWVREAPDMEIAKTLLVVRFTGDLEANEAELRRQWGGAMCVAPATYSMAELTRIQDELSGRPGLLSLNADVVSNRVQVVAYVASAATKRELDQTYGPGVVELYGWFVPID